MKVEIVKEVGEETILREVIRKVKRGGLVYTDNFKVYVGLVMYGFKHERIWEDVFIRYGLYKWDRRFLELCEGKTFEVSWYIF